jgi:signal transduction histidine kinase
VTHELKTPVASIRLYLETLQKRPLGEEKRQEFYQIMLADSDRLLLTIEQVLRAARAATAKAPANRSRLDVGRLVEEVLGLARLRHRLPPESVRFAHAAGGRFEILGDPDELKSAVSNLVDNAIKYSGSKVKVWVRVEPGEEKFVAVRVRDEGMGIPRVELKRIFRRFYRIPGAAALRVKGTGIGLFIVRSVAERHGGKAYAESGGAGQGSTFTLELPLAGPENRE